MEELHLLLHCNASVRLGAMTTRLIFPAVILWKADVYADCHS
jgi:hypothetical protein